MSTVNIYKNSSGFYTLRQNGEAWVSILGGDKALANKICGYLNSESDPYLVQYPNADYIIAELSATNLRVTCPVHGDFEISRDNFLYQRGCVLCRGLHSRAYPLQSTRKSYGNPVYINGDGSASNQPNNAFYAASFRDKRVAAAAIKVINSFAAPCDISLIQHALVAMATSNIVPPRKAVEKKNTAKNCVFIRIADDGTFTAYPPDTIYTSAHCLAFYSTRLEAELVYHILTKLKPEQTLEAMTILNAANAWAVKGENK